MKSFLFPTNSDCICYILLGGIWHFVAKDQQGWQPRISKNYYLFTTISIFKEFVAYFIVSMYTLFLHLCFNLENPVHFKPETNSSGQDHKATTRYLER